MGWGGWKKGWVGGGGHEGWSSGGDHRIDILPDDCFVYFIDQKKLLFVVHDFLFVSCRFK